MPDNETMLAEFKRAQEMFGDDRVKMLGDTESATQEINKRINQFFETPQGFKADNFPQAWMEDAKNRGKAITEEATKKEKKPTDRQAVIESDYLAAGLTEAEYLIDRLDEINTRLEKLENLVKEIQYGGPRFADCQPKI